MAGLGLPSRFLCLKWPFCQQVWVKIVDVRVEYGMLKISCSMKVICLACLSWLVIQTCCCFAFPPDTASFMIVTLPVQAVSQVDGKDLDPSNTVGKYFRP